MGNKQTEKFDWEKKFIILEKNFNDNTLILQKNQGGQQYIGRQILSTDKKDSEEIKRLIQLKYNKNNPFLTKLVQIYYNNEQGYCSPQDKIYLVFQKPKQTLRQEILARKFANQPFTEEEADIILQSGCKAIRSLKDLKHPHNNVSTSSVFIDEDRKIILGDPWINPPLYSQDINQNVFACPSPEKILLQNDQIMSICPYRSDLFSLGTVILEVLNFQHMDILYEKGFRRLIQSKVNEKLSKIKNQQLRYKLSTVLSHDPYNRDEIFRIYRTSGLVLSNVKEKVLKGYLNNPQQSKKQFRKSFEKTSPIIQLNGHREINPKGIQNKTKITSVQPMPSYNKNLNIHHAQYSSSLPKTNIQTNYINQMNQTNNIQNFTSNSPILYKPTTNNFKNVPNLNETNHMQPLGFCATRPYQLSTYNTKNNFNYPNGLASYTPGSINGTINNYISSHNTHNFSANTNAQNFSTNSLPFNTFHSTIPKQKSHIPPPQFNNMKIQSKDAILQTNSHTFQPTIIKSNDEFVKTSGDIRFVQNFNKSQDSILKEQIENIKHVGNYGVKLGADLPATKTIPPQNLPVQPINQMSVNKKTTLISSELKKQQQNPVTSQINQKKETPERRPNNRKYNSTIKEEPDQCSYSGSRDGDDEYECVIQEYETGKYSGQKKNGMRNGFGKFIYNEGSVYEGNWKDNLMHGKGNLYYSDGKIAYEGDWRMDQFHGFGKVYNEDQLAIKGSYDYTDFSNVNDYWASYEGELNSDRRHGKGKIKFSNGQIFAGSFVADVIEGEGKFYTLNGEIINGIWKNNKLFKKF